MKTKNKILPALAIGAALMVATAAAIATGGATAAFADSEDPAYSYQPVYNDVWGDDALIPTGTYSGSFEAGGLGWTYFSSDFTSGGFEDTRGLVINGPTEVQFSDKDASFVLFSEAFMASGGETLVSRVDVDAAYSCEDGSWNDASVQIYVNGSLVGTEALTRSSSTYRFDLTEPAYGSVEIVFSCVIDGYADDLSNFFFNGIDIYATTNETGTDIVPAIQALEAIKTCEVTVGDATFGAFVSEYGDTITTYREELRDIMIRDYADDDAGYEGYREIRVPFMDKYYACANRWGGLAGVSSLGGFSGGGEATIAAACILLAAMTIGAAVYVIVRKRREA